MKRQDIEPGIECKNIFTGEKILITDVFNSSVQYERKNKHIVENVVIKQHVKPIYVFTLTYQSV